MTATSSLPGGPAERLQPTGLISERTRSRIVGPLGALALVAEDLRLAEIALRDMVIVDVSAVSHIARYITDAGGKRLRPALTALGARALGLETPLPELMCAGELIHLGSLLHDDVVDQGEMRRGQPTAHTVHGNAVAVLTGDFCVARAMLAASEHGSHEAAMALARTVAEMSAGEVVQLQAAGDLSTPLDTYLQVIERKSASLIAWCAAAAALKVGDRSAAAALGRYGRRVGMAYQVTDDVLDYRSDTGKHAGADLRERKVTLPLVHAMQRIPDLRARLEARPPTEDEIPGLIAEIDASGALDAALDDARGFVDEALMALHALPAGEGTNALAVLGRYIVERTT